MQYAIYGAGSLGTVMGAYLTKNGADIQLVNRNKAHVAALQKSGAHITGTVDMTVPVKAILPEEMSGQYDVIFLMTKQLHNDDVAAFLKPFLTPDGVVVTLQNGIPEPGLEAVLGRGHVMGCTVEWGATLAEPGHAILTSSPDSLSFHMGKLPGITDEQFNRVKALLEKMCPVQIEENLLGARWKQAADQCHVLGPGHGDRRHLRRRQRKRRHQGHCPGLHEGVHRRGPRRGRHLRPSAGQGHYQAVLL